MLRRLWSPRLDWALLGAWLGVIFYWSNQPNPNVPGVNVDWVRKGMHVVEYALLFILWRRALRNAFPQQLDGTARWALAATVAYAVGDEIHQHFVGRDGALRDVLIDSVLPLALWVTIEARRRKALPPLSRVGQ